MKQVYLILLLFVFTAATFANGDKEVVRINHLYADGGSSIYDSPTGEDNATFTFDEQGRIISAKSEDGVDGTVFSSTYDYGVSTIKGTTVINSEDGQIKINSVGQLNGNRVTEIRMTEDWGGESFESVLTLGYDSDGYIISSHTEEEDGYTHTDQMVWDNGNLTQVDGIVGDGNLYEYRYDMSKLSPRSEVLSYMLMTLPFDLGTIQFMLCFYPYMGYHPRNLLTGTKESNDGKIYDYRFAYEFDNDGDITKIEVYENDNLTDVYTLGLGASGIQDIVADRIGSEYYSLQGNRVKSPRKGIYIRDGHKVVVRE